jgi:hypothetical protein
MPAHDKDYRENFARSLFLTGKITQEAAGDSCASWQEIFVTFYEDSSNHSQMQLLSGISSVDSMHEYLSDNRK